MLDMTEILNPVSVCDYLEDMGWRNIPFKRRDVKIYQIESDGVFKQVNVPMNKSLNDYKSAMYSVLSSILEVENNKYKKE